MPLELVTAIAIACGVPFVAGKFLVLVCTPIAALTKYFLHNPLPFSFPPTHTITSHHLPSPPINILITIFIIIIIVTTTLVLHPHQAPKPLITLLLSFHIADIMSNLLAQGPSGTHEESDDLEDYVDSEEEEQEEEQGPVVSPAEMFLSKIAAKFAAVDTPAPVAPTVPGTGASGSPSTQAASTGNSQTVAPVTAPLAPGTGVFGSPSTQVMSTEESDSSSLSMASGSEKTVSDFGSSVTSLSFASGAQGDTASAVPQVTGSSEGKTMVVPTPAAENNLSPSHPVTVSFGYTAQESLGNLGSNQAPTTTPPNPLPSTSDDMDIDMWDVDQSGEFDQDGDIQMPDIDPYVEMPDAPPLRRKRSRGRSAPRCDTPIRRRYWGLPCASVRRFGERTADKKNAIRAFSKVLSQDMLQAEAEEWLKNSRQMLLGLECSIDHALHYLCERPFNSDVCQGSEWVARMNFICGYLKNRTLNLYERRTTTPLCRKFYLILEEIVRSINEDPRSSINAPSAEDIQRRTKQLNYLLKKTKLDVEAKFRHFKTVDFTIKYPELDGLRWDNVTFYDYVHYLDTAIGALQNLTRKRVINLRDERPAQQLLKAQWTRMKNAELKYATARSRCKCKKRDMAGANLWEKAEYTTGMVDIGCKLNLHPEGHGHIFSGFDAAQLLCRMKASDGG
ncbi:hypothetical protein TWF788_004161 [Orbilia oligospora]|uniref:Uncharacterized protein n=1 Tax=Orbilia oligospora TaxID=2813651 RepID=A0A7C8Q3E5_ORBOL|nr:hypothetical protein TWF788_004161 [Orbilia oligospora]